MSFASLTFFLFCCLAFGLHYAVRRRWWQNTVLIVASYTFYAWWDYRFCSLMLISSAVDYIAGRGIHGSARPGVRKAYLALSLACNLGMLGFFKYAGFFVESLGGAAEAIGLTLSTTTLRIILPVGISFYTFQTMSYTIDIYRRRFAPIRDVSAYMAFVSFFPQLVAGPIERASHLLPQFTQCRVFDARRGTQGLRLILWGLFKKMVIADNLGSLVDAVYTTPGAWSGPALALATAAFAGQIYADFSAYSDIAAGTARLFGIELMRNFAYPGFSRSPGEFWRRWHISLSTWFRDYVFIPLGGSRCGPVRRRVNLLVTFLVSGLWHGAAWNFVIWGGLNGLALIPGTFRHQGARRDDGLPGGSGRLPSPAALAMMAGTQLVVGLTWVFFRTDTLRDAGLVLRRIVTWAADDAGLQGVSALPEAVPRTLCLWAGFLLVEWMRRDRWDVLETAYPAELVAGIGLVVSGFALGMGAWIWAGGIAVGGLVAAAGVHRWRRQAPEGVMAAGRWVLYSLLFWLIMAVGTYSRGAFIYFQF